MWHDDCRGQRFAHYSGEPLMLIAHQGFPLDLRRRDFSPQIEGRHFDPRLPKDDEDPWIFNRALRLSSREECSVVNTSMTLHFAERGLRL
ncbi:hypothetical protein TNCV_4032531 [Trichonephila clavipes]|nr:hypothetical protein TNCV_4032531 [Trichonephila clavipes]